MPSNLRFSCPLSPRCDNLPKTTKPVPRGASRQAVWGRPAYAGRDTGDIASCIQAKNGGHIFSIGLDDWSHLAFSQYGDCWVIAAI